MFSSVKTSFGWVGRGGGFGSGPLSIKDNKANPDASWLLFSNAVKMGCSIFSRYISDRLLASDWLVVEFVESELFWLRLLSFVCCAGRTCSCTGCH